MGKETQYLHLVLLREKQVTQRVYAIYRLLEDASVAFRCGKETFPERSNAGIAPLKRIALPASWPVAPAQVVPGLLQ